MKYTKKEKSSWVKWLLSFGPLKLLDAFLKNVEGAESTCIHCGQRIFVDVMIGGGVADWSTEDGDFGCDSAPDATKEATGSHMPTKRTKRI